MTNKIKFGFICSSSKASIVLTVVRRQKGFKPTDFNTQINTPDLTFLRTLELSVQRIYNFLKRRRGEGRRRRRKKTTTGKQKEMATPAS